MNEEEVKEIKSRLKTNETIIKALLNSYCGTIAGMTGANAQEIRDKILDAARNDFES